jgi:mono/diheme cytochrome c family protein
MIDTSCFLRPYRLAFVLLLSLTGAAVAEDEQETIGWTRHTPQASASTPRGFLEYQNSCSVCHGPMPERPGTRALAAKYKGTVPAMLEDRKDLSPDLIRVVVRNGITVMPQFRKTELSDGQLEAIVAYLTRPRS